MSRLTYFHKATPEDIPRPVQLPASPPETELDHMVPHQPSEISPETPASRFRRAANSSISYLNSAAATPRDARPVGPRTSRWLVVVFPPQSLTREPAALGHTLSTSANGRFNNGILMPLFPTMYGQLTAIAREFGLPSVSGVCIYLHMADAGVAMTPRISDDTWQLLWGHFFDDAAAQPQPGSLPISGRIEFDIDVRKARWYQAWTGEASVPPSVAPSVSQHRRQQSRSTLFGDDDARSENGLYPLQLASSSRATVVNRPRKLNLLPKNGERPSAPQAAQRDIILLDDQSPPSEQEVTASSKRLSPVLQEDEPATAKLVEVDRRVMQWRIASGTSPNPLSNKTGQISLDPAHMPNSAPETPAEGKVPVDVVGEEDEEGVELNLDDFAWSISSAGPGSYLDSPSWPEPLPSVHMEWRAQGSVPPTPTTATTNWPYEYPDSPFSVASRLPSPDIAYRMLEDAPCTPTTATSWGPASYPPSPAHSEYYAASIDIGQRMSWSRPATPATATSWGPMESYPPSPAFTVEYIYTPGIADRSFELEQGAMSSQHPRFASFPYYSAWNRQPWGHVWPYTQASAPRSTKSEGIAVIALAYPFSQGIYGPVNSSMSGNGIVVAAVTYPFTGGIYPAVDSADTAHSVVVTALAYPFSEGIYAAVNSFGTGILVAAVTYPFAGGVYPAVISSSTVEGITVVSLAYPFSQGIYTAVDSSVSIAGIVVAAVAYPFTGGVYPAASAAQGIVVAALAYPFFKGIYAAVDSFTSVTVMLRGSSGYPFTDGVYPPMSTIATTPVRVMLSGSLGYPFTYGVYPPRAVFTPVHVMLPGSSGYPFASGVYPSATATSLSTTAIHVMLNGSTGYPFTYGVYPARAVASASLSVQLMAVYPSMQQSLYPAVYPHNLANIYPTANIHAAYVLDLYPAGYPHSLSFIYPAATMDSCNSAEPLSVRLPITYPSLTIYEPIYPNFDIYPGPSALHALPERPEQWRKSVSTDLASLWPTLTIYRAEYPYFDLYPGVTTTGVQNAKAASRVLSLQRSTPLPQSIRLPALYPTIEEALYPAVYPYSLQCIYPTATSNSCSVSVPTATYPFATGIYPAVYPFNLEVIYPRMTVVDELASRIVALGYPFSSGIYPAVYPYSMMAIYPPVQIEAGEGLSLGVDCHLHSRYPYLQLYEPRYPHVSPYPVAVMAHHEHHSRRASSPSSTRRRSSTVSRPAHRDGKTHAVRGSISRRISAEGAPPVPTIPAHIRTPSSSPTSSRPSSLTVVPGAERSTGTPQADRARKTHKELHNHYYVDPSSSHDGVELLELLDRFPSPVPSKRPARTHAELHELSVRSGYSPSEERAPAAGSTKMATVRGPSPTTSSPGHSARRSVVFDKIKQFSPVDETTASPPLSRSSSHTRPVSRLDRSKYPFA